VIVAAPLACDAPEQLHGGGNAPLVLQAAIEG
jgi:hypothetical protein